LIRKAGVPVTPMARPASKSTRVFAA
jgi:hypothetical protein